MLRKHVLLLALVGVGVAIRSGWEAVLSDSDDYDSEAVDRLDGPFCIR